MKRESRSFDAAKRIAAAASARPDRTSLRFFDGRRASLSAQGASARTAPPCPMLSSGIMLPVPWRSEEHTSELQSLMRISYAVFCLKKKKKHEYRKYTIKTYTATQTNHNNNNTNTTSQKHNTTHNSS